MHLRILRAPTPQPDAVHAGRSVLGSDHARSRRRRVQSFFQFGVRDILWLVLVVCLAVPAWRGARIERALDRAERVVNNGVQYYNPLTKQIEYGFFIRLHAPDAATLFPRDEGYQ